jgi:hypothetical protein
MGAAGRLPLASLLNSPGVPATECTLWGQQCPALHRCASHCAAPPFNAGIAIRIQVYWACSAVPELQDLDRRVSAHQPIGAPRCNARESAHAESVHCTRQLLPALRTRRPGSPAPHLQCDALLAASPMRVSVPQAAGRVPASGRINRVAGSKTRAASRKMSGRWPATADARHEAAFRASHSPTLSRPRTAMEPRTSTEAGCVLRQHGAGV